MSEYFRVLNRLREEANTPHLRAVPRPAPAIAPAPAAAAVAERPAPVVKPEASVIELRPRSTKRTVQTSPASSALQDVIDTLQRIRSSGGSRCLVLAPASGNEDVDGFAVQIVRLMRDRGLAVDAVRVSEHGSSELRGGGMLEELALDIDGGNWSAELTRWQSARSIESVSLLVAPPLTATRCAALVARQCDGLALLVELRHTPRKALAQAVKRSQEVGCTLLGMIVVGSEGLPGWARRIWKSFV